MNDKAKGEIGLETLAGRQKSARVSLLMKVIADNSESSAVVIRRLFLNWLLIIYMII